MDDGDDLVDSVMEDSRHNFTDAIYSEKRDNPFTANRFDVGYDRGKVPFRSWNVR